MAEHSMVCIRGGEVRACVGCEDDEILRECLAQWAMDPATEIIVKAPIEVVRKTLFATKDEFFAELSKATASPSTQPE